MGDILSQDEIDALLSATEGDQGATKGGQGAAESEQNPLIKLLQAAEVSIEEFPPLWGQVQHIVEQGLDAAEEDGKIWEVFAQKLAQKGRREEEIERAYEQVKTVLPAAKERARVQKGEIQEYQGEIVTSYDFKHPARVNKDQLRTLENLHDNFARLLSSTLSAGMHAVVDVDTAFVDQTTYAEFIMSLSNPSNSYQFTVGPSDSQAIIDFAMPVTFAFVDRIFGGKGSSQGVDARVLTPIEVGIFSKVVKRVIEDLEETWRPILRVEISDVELETNPEFMQITAASEIVILLAFEISSKNASGLISLCYPFFTLEPILPFLGQQSYMRSGQEGDQRPSIERRTRLGDLPLDVLGPTPMELSVEMGRARLPLSQASALQVGDVMRMDSRTSDPCVVFVGDKPKYYARPFAGDNDSVHAEVIGPFPRELYGDYDIS